jgi:hypothetical protein
MDAIKSLSIIVIAGLLLCSATMASQGEDVELIYEFQYDQLMDPSAEQLRLEREGYVFIYDGLKESDIQVALDRHQDRMASMMFINVVWTDEAGNPVVDPDTGQPLVDDDC